MEEIKAPKKERRFLKAVGEVALTLFRELLLNVGKKVINKVGNKRQGLVIAIVVLALSFAFAQYPTTGNKQRLGYQTTGDGLVYRGRASDTVSLKSTGLNNAYIIIDTLQNVMYNYIKTKGGWQFNNADTIIINNNFSQPVDSLFFNVNVPTDNVDTAKMRWDSDFATVVLGLNDNVANELGFKNFWLVKNQTGSTITKGSIVYANGTVGASGRITVAKFIANGTIDAKYLLGITAHDLSNGEDGYVISFGKIRKVKTDTFAAGAILYPSPTTAGVWTDVEPIAPNIDMPIGFCINSHVNNGTIAIRVASGYKLNELHDIAITSPVDRGSLYYRGGLWRDTTTALLTSDTASMLTNYLRSGVASNTYLPLTGGTLTGALNGTTGRFNIIGGKYTWDNGDFDIQPFTNYSSTTFGIKFDGLNRPLRSLNFYFPSYNEEPRQAFRFIDSRINAELLTIELFSGNVGINKVIPAYKLDVNGTFNASGNSLIGGTLGVTGATTLSNLAGSGNRMVTASSTGLLSTQTILTPTTRGSNTFTLPDIGAISFLRYNADNSVSQRAADGMRSDLGGTTIGQSMFTLTNPSSVTFPRFNADNTVTALDAASFRTAIGAGTGNGNGTVTSVTGTLPISSSGGTTPNITIANASTTASGVVTTSTQSMAGNKTFTGNLATSGEFSATGFSTLTGGASVGTMAATSSLTHVIGVNSSNTIGEIGLNSVFSLSSGVLNIQDAGASQRGIVTSTTQSFGGNKTFTDIVGFSKAIQRPIATITGNTTIQTSNCWVIVNNTGGTTTLTLPDATLATGSELMIKTAQPQAVISASSNVVPLTFANTPSSNIIPATDGAWCTLVSNGTYWVIMQANF